MYLALLPSEESLKALKLFAPQMTGDGHLTVVHSKQVLLPGMPLPSFPTLPISVECAEMAVFGGRQPVCVLRLRASGELLYLRAWAELELEARGVAWSREWPFSPHVTVGKQGDRFDAPPASLSFDRLEWRP